MSVEVGNSRPELTIVYPAYNEAAMLADGTASVIGHTLQQSMDYFERHLPGFNYRLMVMDDGSTDATAEEASKYIGKENVLQYPDGQNRGKGAAVRYALTALAAGSELIAYADADGAFTPDQIMKLYIAHEKRDIDVAAGKRHEYDGLKRRMTSVGNRAIVHALAPGAVWDVQCGLKMFKPDAAQFVAEQAVNDGFGFDHEFMHIARRIGLKVLPVKVSIAPEVRDSHINILKEIRRFPKEAYRARQAHKHLTGQAFRSQQTNQQPTEQQLAA